MSIDLSRALHVVDGHSAALTLREAFGLDSTQILANEDPLYWGPIAAAEDVESLINSRAAFLSDMYGGEPDPFRDSAAFWALQLHLDRLSDVAPQVVWTTVGLPSQLLLAWLMHVYAERDLDPSTLHVVEFARMRPLQRILGMGELSASQIVEFHPPPRRLTADEIAAYRDAWRAYGSADPAALKRLLEGARDTSLLKQAMRRLIERYPSARTGLSACDEDVIRHTHEHGPGAARVVGETMGRNQSPDCFSDLFIMDRAERLADQDLASPLLTTNLKDRAAGLRGVDLHLTDFGCAVLADEANAIEVNGVDDWIGGVRLLGPTPPAYRDGGVLKVAS